MKNAKVQPGLRSSLTAVVTMPNDDRRSWLARLAAPFLLAVFTAVYFSARFRAGDRFLAFFEDDFFYYQVVARNIASGAGSTFDGIHLTNGYHPLWLLLNVLLSACFQGKTFYYVLLAIMAAGVFLTYGAVMRCFALYMCDRNAQYCALLIAAQFLLIMSGGMEIVLTVPLVAILCYYRLFRFRWTLTSGLSYGLLASLVILSRLDAVLLVGLLGLLELAFNARLALRLRARVAAGFCVGLLPVVVYIVINLAVFHIATPVSGAAKQLRTSHSPDLAALKITFLGGWLPVTMLSRPLVLGFAAAVALLLLRGRGRLMQQNVPLVWALMLFPFLQLGALSVLSDWPIWEWYFYPFVVAGIGVILTLGARQESWLRPASRFAGPVAAIVALCLLVKITVHDIRAATMPQHAMYDFYYAARDISAFAQTHPGIYAMGDRAGLVGLEINRPLIQLEGLMMDKPFLQNIRERRDVLSVLNDLHVRYYIATNLRPATSPNCLLLREPVQAGPTSPVMQGTLCSPPIYQFRYNGIHTYIFDMQQ